MKKELTKAQLQQKYADAKREIIRLHIVSAELRRRLSESAAGVEQLRRGTDTLLTHIVLTRGADTGHGHELYISSAEKDILLRFKLTAARTETAGMLMLRVEPRE